MNELEEARDKSLNWKRMVEAKAKLEDVIEKGDLFHLEKYLVDLQE